MHFSDSSERVPATGWVPKAHPLAVEFEVIIDRRGLLGEQVAANVGELLLMHCLQRVLLLVLFKVR